jgi:hypothetical protein
MDPPKPGPGGGVLVTHLTWQAGCPEPDTQEWS